MSVYFPTGAKPEDFKRGDRVRDEVTGEEGRVYAVFAPDAEDNVEILLDSGSYTSRDSRRLRLVFRLTLSD